MARGNCFCVTRDLEKAADLALSETDLYEYVDELGIDYVEDEAEPQERIRELIDMLEGYGAECGSDVDCAGNQCMYFILYDGVKEELFRERYDLLKKKAEQITLSQFSCGSGAVWALRETVEDTCGDCICDDRLSCPENMDTFIRYALTGEKYYVTPRVVLMH